MQSAITQIACKMVNDVALWFLAELLAEANAKPRYPPENYAR